MIKQIIFALSGLMLIGCRSEPTMPGGAGFPTRNTYSVPPKAMVEKVRSVISSPPIELPIETEQEGRLVTGWQSNTGAKVGVAGIGRTWQERTRYTITIAPAWDDPANKSTVEVTEESQQRPHDHWEWGSQEPIKRPERAADLAKAIDSALAHGSSH